MTLWFLRFLNGSKAGQAVRLAPGSNRVGRKPECEVCLSDPGISGVHATIEITEAGAVLRDENSLNGTYVKDFSISRHEVAPGLEISFGLVRARLEKLDRPLSPAPAASGDLPRETVPAHTPAAPLDKTEYKTTIPVKVDYVKKVPVSVSTTRRKPSVAVAPEKSRLNAKSLIGLLCVTLLAAVGIWMWLGARSKAATPETTAAPSADLVEKQASIATLPAAGENILAPAAKTGGEPRLFWVGGNGTTRLQGIHALSNGDYLLAGATSDLEWTSPAPRTLWPVKETRGNGGEMTAFVLHVSGDWKTIRHVYHFPPGVMEEVTRIRSTEVPGHPTGSVYLSGQYGGLEGEEGGYWIARLNQNFVEAQPTDFVWLSFIRAPARQAGGFKGVGEYARTQPWDVRNDGDVIYVTGSPHDFSWAAFGALDGKTGEYREMPGWFLEGDRTLIAMKAGRKNSLRSVTDEDFFHRQEDENDNPGRRGRFPDDMFFQGPGLGGPGYTGYRIGNANTQRVGKIDIDRRNNFLYFGYSTQSRLPNGNPDFEPAIVAMDDRGNLLWWARGYREVERVGDNEGAHQDAINSPPDQYIDGVAVDYANNQLVVGGRSHGNGVINFWRGNEIVRNPGGNGFQNQITGTSGNIHVMWFGRYGLLDGKIYSSTYMAELAEGARTAEPIVGGLLDGWPSPNSGWPNVTSTRLRDLMVDHQGRLHVAGVGRRPITTNNALIENVKPGQGVSAWSDFVRVYRPDSSSIDYSTILRGPWDVETGAHAGDSLELTAVQPVLDGVIAVGFHDPSEEGKNSALPVTGVPAWGSETFQGSQMGVVAVLPVR